MKAETHCAKITENRRSLIILMLDQSGSMSEPFDQTGQGEWRSKAEVVAETTNMLLSEIVSRCRQHTVYRHYFDIGVIGYSGMGVYSLLPNNRWLLSPSEMASCVRRTQRICRRVLNAAGRRISLYSDQKIWVEPQHEGRTPMFGAFERLSEMLYRWRQSLPSADSFPPTIINITDGEVTDAQHGELLGITDKIRTLGTNDGEPILLNVHISSNHTSSVIFPASMDEVPEQARLLYDLSSVMPQVYNNDIAAIKEQSNAQSKQYRALGYNASVDDLIRIMNIGTSTTQQIEN